jgi:3-hydroxy-9,10-secoandrosta-1,3,5(10)-triene-9,17-dione monooxygenase reductase component
LAVDEESFKQALGRFASGVTVVTMGDGEDKAGLTVSAFCSVSLEPPYILVCINNVSTALAIMHKTNRFAVNILAADQTNLSNHFASRLEDKFQNIKHHPGVLGLPLLEDVMAQLECTVVNEFPGGDHTILIGRVEEATIDTSKQPLLYFHGQYGAFQ